MDKEIKLLNSLQIVLEKGKLPFDDYFIALSHIGLISLDKMGEISETTEVTDFGKRILHYLEVRHNYHK